MTKTTDPAARLAQLRDESSRLQELDARAQATLERLAVSLPAAAADVDLARVATEPGALDEAQDRHRKLELEQANAESVIRGCATRRQLLTWELQAAEAQLARAEARTVCPAADLGTVTEEALVEAFGYLAELVSGGIRATIAVSPRDDARGLTEAASLDQLVRWLRVQCARAGLDLDSDKHLQAGAGVGPAVTLENFTACLEALR